MTFARLVAVFATVLIAAAASAADASATTTAECQAQLSELRTDTVAAEGSFTNAKDFDHAVGKLDAAAAKLESGKTADAAGKVRDFQALLTALSTAPKPKLDAATAQRLVDEAQGVADCIDAIETAT